MTEWFEESMSASPMKSLLKDPGGKSSKYYLPHFPYRLPPGMSHTVTTVVATADSTLATVTRPCGKSVSGSVRQWTLHTRTRYSSAGTGAQTHPAKPNVPSHITVRGWKWKHTVKVNLLIVL